MNKIGVTEHIEADECKFALWEGTVAPISDYKLILRVFSYGIYREGQKWCGEKCFEYEVMGVKLGSSPKITRNDIVDKVLEGLHLNREVT